MSESIETMQEEIRRKTAMLDRPSSPSADFALRRKTIKESLEEKRARMIKELAQVDEAIQIIKDNQRFEELYTLISKLVY